MIEYADYLKALEVVRQYRSQKARPELNKNSTFFEWNEQLKLRHREVIQKLFFDGFFNVRSGMLKDLNVMHLSEVAESEYRKQEGVGNSFIESVKKLCKSADFILEP